MQSQFSVLISTYKNDNPHCLKKAIESIFNQSLPPTQVVLVIDGEILAENATIISKFEIEFVNTITVVKLPINVGLGNALNEGLKHCKYNLVARMDADDECFFERFKTQISYFETNPNLAVVGSFVEEFHTIPKDYGRIKKAPVGYEAIKKYAAYRNPLNHPSVMFKKDAIETVGSYKEINLFEDYYLWLRLIKANFILENIPQSLVYFKIGNDLIDRRHGWKYLKKEYLFFKTCLKEGLITNKSFYVQLFTRLPLRLLPKKLLLLIYKKLLRH